jgi:capsule biosynthesis phosphatase
MTAKIIIDLDGTITVPNTGTSYENVEPNREIVNKLRDYRAEGFKIVIYTARNMRTYESSVGKINAVTLPIIIDWLRKHDIPFDEIHVGKPWCGHDGFYVDDKAIRPDEFRKLSQNEIMQIIKSK